VLRMGTVVVAMELAALVVAYGYFGWPVLLIGAPALVGTVMVLVFVRASEAPRRMLDAHRAARWDPNATLPVGGLMSGFFELPKQRPRS
jgi:hypothetical protein